METKTFFSLSNNSRDYSGKSRPLLRHAAKTEEWKTVPLFRPQPPIHFIQSVKVDRGAVILAITVYLTLAALWYAFILAALSSTSHSVPPSSSIFAGLLLVCVRWEILPRCPAEARSGGVRRDHLVIFISISLSTT